MAELPFVIVAAMAENRGIGLENRLIWRLKTDLRRFRGLTLGRPVVMGRKTFQSIGKPLPGRETIVLTRDPGFRPEGAHVAATLAEALATGQRIGRDTGADSVVVAGGADIYRQMMPMADRLELTFVHTVAEADAFFPEWNRPDFEEVSREEHPRGPDDEHAFSFATFRRRRPG
jgi:dihydrofolate reductase